MVRVIYFALIQMVYLFSASSWGGVVIRQDFNCSPFLQSQFPFTPSSAEEPMEILTPRLVLRSGTDADYEAIKNVYGKVFTIRGLLFGGWDLWTKRDSYFQHQRLMRGIRETPVGSNVHTWDFVIALRETNQMIGGGFVWQYDHRWEFSFLIDPRYRRQGYATEGLEGFIRFVREMDPNARFHSTVETGG